MGVKETNVWFCCRFAGTSSVADDSLLCPHMMQRAASPYFFELGLVMKVYQTFLSFFFFCFLVPFFIAQVDRFHNFTVYRLKHY